MDPNIPVLCGTVSTVIFVLGTLPMIVKAAQTKDLSSYSFGNIAMANTGNLINSVYVFSLPVGPLWALHSFNMASTALMLGWYLRYQGAGLRLPVSLPVRLPVRRPVRLPARLPARFPVRPARPATYKSPTWRAIELHSLPEAEVLTTLLTSSYSSRRESELVGTTAGG